MSRHARIFPAAILLLLFGLSACARGAASAATEPSLPAATATPAPTAEPEIPEPEEPDPTPEPEPVKDNFELDPARLAPDAKTALGDATADFRALLDAVRAGEAEITLSSPENAEAALQALSESLYAGCAEATLNDNTVTLRYDPVCTPKAAEAAALTLAKKADITGLTRFETALLLYRAAASAFTYAESDGKSASLAWALCTGNADSEGFARTLQFLYTQYGISARLVRGETEAGPRCWVAARIDGAWYHFDPAFESAVTAGKGLWYFAMSDGAITFFGCPAPYTVGDSERVATLASSSPYDEVFREVTDWSLDADAHSVALTYAFSEEPSAVFSTAEE